MTDSCIFFNGLIAGGLGKLINHSAIGSLVVLSTKMWDFPRRNLLLLPVGRQDLYIIITTMSLYN